jgi:hypothetical protein
VGIRRVDSVPEQHLSRGGWRRMRSRISIRGEMRWDSAMSEHPSPMLVARPEREGPRLRGPSRRWQAPLPVTAVPRPARLSQARKIRSPGQRRGNFWLSVLRFSCTRLPLYPCRLCPGRVRSWRRPGTNLPRPPRSSARGHVDLPFTAVCRFVYLRALLWRESNTGRQARRRGSITSAPRQPEGRSDQPRSTAGRHLSASGPTPRRPQRPAGGIPRLLSVAGENGAPFGLAGAGSCPSSGVFGPGSASGEGLSFRTRPRALRVAHAQLRRGDLAVTRR